MNKLSFISSVLPWVLLAVLCNYFAKFILFLDINRRAYNHVPGSCHAVAAIEDGAEDIEYIGKGLAIIVSGLRLYGNVPELNATKGKIYMYNFTGNSAWELSINSKRLSKKSFNPHGITSWTAAKSRTTVYIINHHPKGDRIEVFQLDRKQKALNHTKTIRSETFHNLNNLVAVGQDKLFAINFHYFNTSWLQNAEFFLALKMGSIIFHNGSETHFVQRWILTPSGIAWDKSKRYLLVSSYIGEAIKVYKINSFLDGSISFVEDIPLYTAPDNLYVDHRTGDIYVACHPVKFRHWLYQGRPKTLLSPSQVLRLAGKVDSQKPMEITEVFASDGATLSSASVAVRYKHQIMIGSMHSRGLVCELNNPDFWQ